jgi:hypothetical protein
MNPSPTRCLAGLAAALGLAGASAQTTIYSDDFDGGAVDIHTLAPDVRPGTETWTASPVFNADGSVDRPATASQGSMTLPFTPADGFIYTLDASFSGVNGDTDWFGLGFARGQSSGSGTVDRFINGNVVGATWMLFRGATPEPLATNGNKIQRGLGAANPADWLDPVLWELDGGDIDLRIVLDTTGGTGAWTATWYAKLPADASYSRVGATTAIPHDASNYTSVGIAASNSSPTAGTGGTIGSFSLSAVAGVSLPAITGIAFDGGGNLVLTLDGPAAGLTVQQSDHLGGFSDLESSADGSTLTIEAAKVDPEANGRHFFRVRN